MPAPKDGPRRAVAMTVLTADDLEGRHRYLAQHRPEWARSIASIRSEGGPWSCPNGCVSYLCYRCSVCGKDLADAGSSASQRG